MRWRDISEEKSYKMRNNRSLQGIGVAAIILTMLSIVWTPIHATVTLNSTANVDILKLLEIQPSSGEIVIVSGTHFNNTDNTVGSIKTTGNLEIEKSNPRFVLNTTGTVVEFEFVDSGTASGWMIYNVDTDIWSITDAGGTDKFQVNSTTGDITKLGKFTQDVEIEEASPRLVIDGGSPSIFFEADASTNPDIFFGIDGANNASFGWDSSADFFQMIGAGVKVQGDILPTANETYDLGSPTKYFDLAFIKTGTIGDLQEEHEANPAYNYSVGDVVAVDRGKYSIMPATEPFDMIVGSIARLPYWFNDSEGNSIYINTTSVVIVGTTPKHAPVRVNGTINKGDYLVASGNPGVATSMFNRNHPLPSLSGILRASNNKNTYNYYAAMLPRVGIAMENYNSPEIGTIKVFIEK